MQTFREAPDLQSRLDTAENELKLAASEVPDLRARLDAAEHDLKAAKQSAEQWEEECLQMYDAIEEKDARIQFLDAKSEALSSALMEFSPKLSTTEEMKRFYDVISADLDPDGFTLYRVAMNLTGIEVASTFPYEDALGKFEYATGHDLMNYLTACYFGAVEWDTIPGSTYESASLGEIDETTSEYQQFERQIYESVLKRMGFDELLAPAPEQVQEHTAQPDNMTLM